MSFIFNQAASRAKRRSLRRNMTVAEILLWSKLRGCQVCGLKFKRQFGIGPYIIDFYCPQLKLAIEVDGDSHSGDRAVKYDLQRQGEIERLGLSVLRVGNRDVYDNIEGVVEAIATVCREKLCEERDLP